MTIHVLPMVRYGIGDRDVRTHSATHNSGKRAGRSSTTSLRREGFLDVADLRAFPTGRALLFASGTPTVLAKLVHYSELDESVATMVKESEAHYAQIGAQR